MIRGVEPDFSSDRWPGLTLIVGDSGQDKNNHILNIIASNLGPDKNLNLLRMKTNDHPDYYGFPEGYIKIGSEKDPEFGSVRHMLKHFLPYSPGESATRFVYFPEAGMIRDEAESALLKSFEEPPKHTRFILGLNHESDVSQTIRSRGIILPWISVFDKTILSPDPWKRFLQLSTLEETAVFDLADKSGWWIQMKNLYENFSFGIQDYPALDMLAIGFVKKYYPKENYENQLRLVRFSMLPMFYAIRDALVEGEYPTESGFRIRLSHPTVFLELNSAIKFLYRMLDIRYFGTRPPSLALICTEFLRRFFSAWIKIGASP